jgi:hypothetical protein
MHLNHKTHEISIWRDLKTKTTTVQKIKTAAAGCIWMTGLLIAGSDSPYMPWLNGLGILMFSGISLISGQWLSRLDRADSGTVFKTPPSRPGTPLRLECKKTGWGIKPPWPREHLSACQENVQGRIFSKI